MPPTPLGWFHPTTGIMMPPRETGKPSQGDSRRKHSLFHILDVRSPIKLQPEPQQTYWQFRTCEDQLPFHPGKPLAQQAYQNSDAAGELESLHTKMLLGTSSSQRARHMQLVKTLQNAREEVMESLGCFFFFCFLSKAYCHHKLLQASEFSWWPQMSFLSSL